MKILSVVATNTRIKMEKLINTMVDQPFWSVIFAIGFAIAFGFGWLCAFTIIQSELENEEKEKRSASQEKK